MDIKKGKRKKRIIIFTLSFVAMLGAGAVFATLNAGEQLEQWFNGLFNESSVKVQSDADDYAAKQNEQLSKDYEKIKNSAVGNVQQAGIDEAAKAVDDVNKAAQEYIDSIDAEKKTLSAGLQKRFDDLVNAYMVNFNLSADEAQVKALQGLEEAINAEGNDGQTLVNISVPNASKDAKARLEKAIADAKKELQDLLKDKEKAATDELKNQIDAKIQLVLTALQEKANLLEAENKALIQAAADQAVDKAIADLDAVVASIP